MKVSDIFVSNQITSQGQSVAGQDGVILRQNAQQGQQGFDVNDFKPGQIISGELLQAEDGEALIKLTNNATLNAKLDQNILLELGKTMNFQVRSNGTALMLTPLQANLSVEGPVSRALEMANLPVNSATGELTKLLMQAGLPIDKNHLQQYFREMVSHPSGQISDLVDLHRLGMPVTEENLSQMNSYKNLTHQLTLGLNQTSEDLFQTISNLTGQGKTTEAAQLFRDVLTLMSEENLPEDSQGEKIQGERIQNPVNLSEEFNVLSGKELTDKIDQFLKQENYSVNDKIDFVSRLLTQGMLKGHEDLAKAVLDSPEVKRLLSDQMGKQWSITPEQVQDPKEVERLYQRLGKQLKGITTALENANQTQTNAFQSATNMNQNLDFLNQINHMYSYVQLPLRLQQGEAHGDLYVYANKKNLAQKDGPITALLHLDMEHLGPVDVYVSMQNQKVGTKFTVGDDETLDFLEAHMDLLTARLEKRGYQISVQTSVKVKEDASETSGIGPILEKESPGLMIQTRGFDVRT